MGAANLPERTKPAIVGEAALECSRRAPRGDGRQRVGKEKSSNLGDPADGGKVGVVHRPSRRKSDGPIVAGKGLTSPERRGPTASAQLFDFLGFTFRYDRDLFGSGKTYLNVVPSKKSLKKAWDAIREESGAKKCFKPTPAVVKDLNTFLRGWSNYFDFGYPRKAFRDLSHYARKRMVTHLNRRSQRKYHRPKGMSHYQYLQELGLLRL